MGDKLAEAKQTAEATVELGQAVITDLSKHTEQIEKGIAQMEAIDQRLSASSTTIKNMSSLTKIIIVITIAAIVLVILVVAVLLNKKTST